MNAFKKNLLIGYGLSLLLLIGSSVASYYSIQSLLDSQKWVNHTNVVINKLESIISLLKDAETGQRGFLLTGNNAFLQPYNGAYERSVVLINDTKQLTVDNPVQQVNCDLLNAIVTKRLSNLSSVIDRKKRGEAITDSILLIGKTNMDAARQTVDSMQQTEQVLLEARTAKLNRFASTTPILIIVASGLAILVTLVSFFRVLKDFSKRAALQAELQKKDEEISKRLTAVRTIADQISAGDYRLKVDDERSDALGGISGSLNKMALSLDASFTALTNREWLQTAIAELNEQMIGQKDLQVLTYQVLEFITGAVKSPIGAFYLVKDEKTLSLSAGIALDKSRVKSEIAFGEGLAGQSALAKKQLLLDAGAGIEMVVSFSAGSFKPSTVIAVPVFYDGRLKGVMELASLQAFTPIQTEFLKSASYNIGLAIHSALDYGRLQELLGETQAQSEELQAQHSELENINAELEAQAEKLQTSEEELRVQQEELQQANSELEERSRLLEEKNELILERNLDIQKKAEELELSTKYKSEFLANMSHELRTPLNSILLLSRLLSENNEHNLSNDQVEYANVIQTSGKGLLTLIDEILDLSKIESGKMELEFGSTTIDSITREINSLFSPVAKDKGISFSIDVKNGVPDSLETDRLRLDQILRNLISNALKFTKKGSVQLILSGKEDSLSFTVKDTGIGIAKDKQQTIFEAFQQADGSTRRQFGGTGLGLSISRELAKLLGGEITLVSEEGKGSEFSLLVPLKQQPTLYKEPEEIPETFHRQQPANDKPAAASTAKEMYLSEVIPPAVPDDRASIKQGDKAILIIEDDTAFARSLLDYTRTKGYKGIVAVRGDEGIELAKQFLPLGILLDVQLPVKSGWQVMEELKAHQATKPIPVHMMSSHEVKNKSLSIGAIDFINKPVAFEQLSNVFQRIEQALSRYPKKVLIVEENAKHAQALSYFLENSNVTSEVKSSISEGITALNRNEVDCVILDMGIPAQRSYEILEEVKKTPGLENLPIIVFTGKNLSHVEEMKIRQYADSIVVKTAHSYQRILDEVSLFLHLVEENKKADKAGKYKKLGALSEVLKGKTVLIADDDVRNIFSLTRSLENYGINVISAMDGKEALNQLEAAPRVDLVLMDMMMPEMDGYESTKKIRSQIKYRNLPVIAVTAKAMTGDREKCINAGASDYITKPVDVDQLISLLRVWLYE